MSNKIYVKKEMLPMYIKQLERFRALYQELVTTLMADSQHFVFEKNASNFVTTLQETKSLAQSIKKAEQSQIYSDVLMVSKKLDCSVEELVSKSLELTYLYSNLLDLLLGLDRNGAGGISQIENKLYQAKTQLRESGM
ncbi:hypothetical protein R55227_BLOPHJLP_01585 [Fructobacillus tropaeoli]|uniref:hypothetical protein n=1 Tax=Fructobacillus tropaeoli TaxID=709323 RepID=UPI002D9DD653|nr:hypothetical protein R55227_BLOPHJLP_01585 [Fructobacillus tropaeoli]